MGKCSSREKEKAKKIWTVKQSPLDSNLTFISITVHLRMFTCGNIIDMDPRNFIVMWVEIFIFTCIFYLNNIYFKIYLMNVWLWHQMEKPQMA